MFDIRHEIPLDVLSIWSDIPETSREQALLMLNALRKAS